LRDAAPTLRRAGLPFPDSLPTMSRIYVAGLFRPDVKVEIEAIAAVV
jgi:enamine deaminase RidA (YjgF/YER057c/UK114 family)